MMDNQKNILGEKKVRINRKYPEDLQSYFASHFVVQHRPEYFILSFFELWPPAIIGDAQERQEALDALDMVDAKCVARFVITPGKMRELIDALNENLNNYEEMVKMLIAMEEGEGEDD